jgi:hypothetical protein
LSDHWFEQLNLTKGFLVSVNDVIVSEHQSIANLGKIELNITEGAVEHNLTLRSNNLEPSH